MSQHNTFGSFNLSFFDIKKARKNISNIQIYVVGYARLSFDEDGSGYCSILNQKDIIENVYRKDFLSPTSSFEFIEDDNISGYKFERPGFFKLVSLIESGKCNIIIIKDLSRIGRHGALTQLFIEQCERVGIQIIADDYNSNRRNDNYILGIHTWNNERAVKDASEKVSKVINRQQENGTWLCAVPYGYTANFQTKNVLIDEEASKVVQAIGEMFVYDDFGINKIAKVLTEKGIPTPRMHEYAKQIAEGKVPKKRCTEARWNGPHIAAMLDNDFYNGTFRTGKYTRDGINGADIRTSPTEQNVFSNHHPKIWSDNLWQAIQEKRKKRKEENFRGFKKTESIFHGIVFCGECGHRMYMYRRKNLKPTYVCSQYFKYGTQVCSRNPIKEERLVEMTTGLLNHIKDQCPELIKAVDAILPSMKKRAAININSKEGYTNEINKLQIELQSIEEQRVKQIIAHPEREEMLNTVYDKMYSDTQDKIDRLKDIIDALGDQEKSSKEAIKNITSAMDAIDHIIESGEVNRKNVEALFEKITVHKNGSVDVKLIADLTNIGIPYMNIVDKMPHCSEENAREFEVSEEPSCINEVSKGDPLETTFIQLLALTEGLRRLSQQFVKNRRVQI